MVISAASKVHNANAVGGFTVVPCWRHHTGYSTVHELCPNEKYHLGAEEGFINHRGDFLTREEAYDHALECGQIPAELRHLKAQRAETALFSEDLY